MLPEAREEAISDLLAEHGDKIFSLGLRVCGAPDRAEDLVQETFLQAFRKWEQFEGRAKASTWLYTIATRACQRLQRKRAGEPTHMESLSDLLPSCDEKITVIPDVEDNPLDEHLRKEARESVEAALTTLPDAFRIAVVLKDIVELKIPEIAEVLGIKSATVKTRIHRGRLHLRKALAEGLPKGDAPTPQHAQQVCLDLLTAKQEALDRGITLPLSPTELCSRCKALFDTLDLAQDACADLALERLPDEIREKIEAAVG